MTLRVRVHVEIRPTDDDIRVLGHGHYDTAPLADLIDKVLRSEFGPRILSVSTDSPEEVAGNGEP